MALGAVAADGPSRGSNGTRYALRLSGSKPLSVRASNKLRNDELLITHLAASCLRMELDRIPLWRGDNVATRQVIDDFAHYLYLPRVPASPNATVERAVMLGALPMRFSHLTALVGSEVKVTLEIEAQGPSGVPENAVRIVTENSRPLKFDTHGFEKE
jgi:hypothetical protein